MVQHNLDCVDCRPEPRLTQGEHDKGRSALLAQAQKSDMGLWHHRRSPKGGSPQECHMGEQCCDGVAHISKTVRAPTKLRHQSRPANQCKQAVDVQSQPSAVDDSSCRQRVEAAEASAAVWRATHTAPSRDHPCVRDTHNHRRGTNSTACTAEQRGSTPEPVLARPRIADTQKP